MLLLIATFAIAALLFLLVEARHAVLTYYVAVCAHFLFALVFIGQEFFGAHAVLVERHHLKHAFCRQGHQVGGYLLVGRIGDFALKDVGLEVEIGVVLGFEAHVAWRQFLAGFHIAVYFEIDATLQFGTLSGKFLRIE